MEYSNFVNLCKHLGDQSLPENERWKSLKYVNIAGQAIPGFDFQRLLKEGRINFISNTDVGPGFTILDAANSDMGVTSLKEPVLSFIPLTSVDSFTFVVTKKAEDGSNTISIGELTESISSETYEKPVVIKFSNSVYYFEVGEKAVFPVIFSRNITESDYDVMYEDINGNEYSDVPTEIGTYYIIVTCKNGYTGTGKAKFEIQPK